MKNAYCWALIVVIVCSLFVAVLPLNGSTANAAPLRGDFNADLTVNLADFNLILPALHTTNTKFALTGSDNNYIDLFDYNEFLKTLGNSAAPAYGTKSLHLACQLTTPQPNPGKMLNVGTWNLGNNGSDKMDDTFADQKARIVGQKFKEYKLDVMMLQEVHILRTGIGSDPITGTNLPRIVQEQVPDKLYFQSVYQDQVKHSLVIVSKFPILESGSVDVDGGRKVLYASVQSPAGNLKVFNIHFTNRPDDDNRRYQCNSLRKATEFISTRVKPGDNYIIAGDFNMDYEPGGVFQDGTRNCTDLFNQYFEGTCSGLPCKYYRSDPPGTGVIDFIFGSSEGNPRMYQYCQLSLFGMLDGHELYVGTIEM